MDESEKNDKDKKPVSVPKRASDIQRLKLAKLMNNPAKPVFIPERPEEKLPRVFNPPEFIRNIWGSSAGAGSGDFHVYRGVRRREYARQKHECIMADKNEKDEDFQDKLHKHKKEAKERTAKKRAKRMKKKAMQKAKKCKPGKGKEKESSSEEESEVEEEEDKQQPEKPSDCTEPVAQQSDDAKDELPPQTGEVQGDCKEDDKESVGKDSSDENTCNTGQISGQEGKTESLNNDSGESLGFEVQ